MKKVNLIFCLILFFLSLLLSSSCFAQDNSYKTQTLYSSLGQLIDSSENKRYNIFGDIKGLTAVKIYKTDKADYKIHLLRNTDSLAQFRMGEEAFAEGGFPFLPWVDFSVFFGE